MGNALLIGAGGFVGSVLRYLVGGLFQPTAADATFPYGTLAVNVTGCYAIGFLSQLIEAQGALGPGARAFASPRG